MNDETALKELLSMCRIYSSRGQADKAEECRQLARQIEQRIGRKANDQVSEMRDRKTLRARAQ